MNRAPAATHAIALLQLLARRPVPQPAAALARELGLARSTTYRLLGALADAGFVSHSTETHRWGLGIAAYELGSAYSRQQPLQRLARTFMTRLAEQVGEPSHLAVLHGADVLYVIEERPLGRPPLVSDVGVRLPANVTASGMAMLAQLPSAQISALFPSNSSLVQRHPGAATTVPMLRSELAQVRRRGYAREVGSVTPGFWSVACPVLDHNGLPAASVAVTWEAGPDGDPRREHEARFADAVRETAEGISRRLGGVP